MCVSHSGSIHSVCKEYMDWSSEYSTSPSDFVTWCREISVPLIVRLNYVDEHGIGRFGGSYDAEQMQRHGIRHLSLPVPDVKGGLPDACTLRHVLQETEKLQDWEAVLFHCKAGFGRSMVAACCHLIWRHNVPGRSLVGWARIVRPGAVTTPEQETFLLNLKGAADLGKYLGDKPQSCCVIS